MGSSQMNKKWWRSWARLLLWFHVIDVIVFYLVIWRRTAPDKKDRLQVLPVKTRENTITATGPLVSMIVPARNEEQNIGRCVRSLLEQDYDNFEVIVVDDDSIDGTGRMLDELAATHPQGRHLWVLRLRDLPRDWAGKPHAIHMCTKYAHGEWLLFTDADTWHAPNALRSALSQAIEEQADLMTLGSQQELPTFWERVMMPMAYLGISMLYPPRLVNDPHSTVAVANGQYMLIRHTVYDVIGGYARPDLRATLLDDRDLARVIKETGCKLRFIDGRGLVHVHMYQGLSDTWRGWRKNAYLGNRGGLAFVLLQLVGLPAISIAPFILPLLARLTRGREHIQAIGAKEAWLATALELTPLLAYRTWLNRQMHVPWYYSLTHPLAGALFDGILGQSALRIITKKGVNWRGRQYGDDRDAKTREDLQTTSTATT